MVLVLFAAAASFAAMRARRKLGMAIAAMIKMIATTTSSSMRLKPRESQPLFFRLELRAELYFCLTRINAAPNVSTASLTTVHCNSLPLLVKKKGRKLSFLPFCSTSQLLEDGHYRGASAHAGSNRCTGRVVANHTRWVGAERTRTSRN